MSANPVDMVLLQHGGLTVKLRRHWWQLWRPRYVWVGSYALIGDIYTIHLNTAPLMTMVVARKHVSIHP